MHKGSRLLAIAGATLFFAPAAAQACTYPLPTRAEGESDATYNARINPWIEKWAEDRSRNWQKSIFDQSARVSLARIAQTTGRIDPSALPGKDPPPSVWESVAVPFVNVKGDLRPGPVSLRYRAQMRCAVFEQGSAATAPVGTLVILFEQDGDGGSLVAEGIVAAKANDPRVLAVITREITARQQPTR